MVVIPCSQDLIYRQLTPRLRMPLAICKVVVGRCDIDRIAFLNVWRLFKFVAVTLMAWYGWHTNSG